MSNLQGLANGAQAQWQFNAVDGIVVSSKEMPPRHQLASTPLPGEIAGRFYIDLYLGQRQRRPSKALSNAESHMHGDRIITGFVV